MTANNDKTSRDNSRDNFEAQTASDLDSLEAQYLSDLPTIESIDAQSQADITASPDELQEKKVECPYCWEHIDVFIDPSVAEQRYTEDCQVCCRPIIFDVSVEDNEASVITSNENEIL